MIKSLFNMSGSNVNVSQRDVVMLKNQLSDLIANFDDLSKSLEELSYIVHQNSEMISTLAKVQFDLAYDCAQSLSLDEAKKSSFSMFVIDDDDDLIN